MVRRRASQLTVLAVLAVVTSAVHTSPIAAQDATTTPPAGFSEATPFCAVASPAPGSPSPVEPHSPTELEVGSYNVLFAGGTSNESLDARIPLITDAILASGAGVVGIQEDELIGSRGHTSGRIAQGLADATGAAWWWCFFMANPILPGSPDTYVGGGNPDSDVMMPLANSLGEEVWRTGIGAVSRYPIVDAGAHRLPLRVTEEVEACGTNLSCRFTALFESRAALRVLVDAPGGQVQVVSTHLAHSITGVSSTTRLVQTESLLRWIDAFSHGSAVPVVLTGDFNSSPDSPVRGAIVGAGFLDTFGVAEPDLPGHTSGQDITAPGPTVGSRIDYVFARPGACASPLADGEGVLASAVIGDEPTPVAGGGVLWPSDHYGVVSDLALFPHDPTGCPVTYTARFTTAACTSLDAVAAAMGDASVADVIRLGTQVYAALAAAGQATPGTPSPPSGGSCQVVVAWPAAAVAEIEVVAAAWGTTPQALTEASGRLVLAIVYALAGAA